MKTEQTFVDIEKATVRGLNCAELVRMARRVQQHKDLPRLDPRVLRDIGLDRSTC